MKHFGRTFHLSLLTLPAFVGCASGLPSSNGNQMNDAGQLGQVAGRSCPTSISDVGAISKADFGLDGDVEMNAKAALRAGARIQGLAKEVQADVFNACESIALDLGVSKEELKAKVSMESDVAAACNAAAEAIQATRAGIKGGAKIQAEPPSCEASLDAMAKCVAECDAQVEPGQVKLECEGGKLSGKCEGTCQGSCQVDGSAKCSGTCDGTCQGECTGEIVGKCDGACNGTCDGTMKGGKCDGTCRGTCKGKVDGECSAQCEGSCSAECTMEANGTCDGTCEGECSVAFEEPRCDGELKAPEASAECQADCETAMTAKLDCDPGQVRVDAGVETDTEAVKRLQKTLSKNLPILLRVGTSMGARLNASVDDARASLENMKATVEEAGASSALIAGCFIASLEAQAQASASIQVSVQASASVSGKAAGSAG